MLLLLLILWQVPKIQTGSTSVMEPLEAQRIEIEHRRTLAQIIGGLVLLFGVYLAWRRISAIEKTADAAQKRAGLHESGLVTERFTRAIDQLGNKDSPEVRLGGIYPLERIARDSQPDHWTIVEVLTAFVRNKTGWPHDLDPAHEDDYYYAAMSRGLDASEQAAITVLGRRGWLKTEPTGLDVSGTILPRANFRGLNFAKADLTGTSLEGSDLTNANLEGADLTRVRLKQAILNGAKLAHAQGLTQDQIDEAKEGDEHTKLPDDLVRPEHWKKKAESGADDAEETAS